MREILVSLFADFALPAIEFVILALVGLALRELQRWLKARGASESAQSVTGQLYNVVEDVVRKANQTLVADLKSKGGWDADTAARVKADVKAEAMRLLGDRAAAAKALGLSEVGLEDRVSAVIEAAIDRSKRLKATVVNNAPGLSEAQMQALIDRFNTESGERLLKAFLKPIEQQAEPSAPSTSG